MVQIIDSVSSTGERSQRGSLIVVRLVVSSCPSFCRDLNPRAGSVIVRESWLRGCALRALSHAGISFCSSAYQASSVNMSEFCRTPRLTRSMSAKTRRCPAWSSACANSAASMDPAEVPVTTDGVIPTLS
jgi:hypothetical protein